MRRGRWLGCAPHIVSQAEVVVSPGEGRVSVELTLCPPDFLSSSELCSTLMSGELLGANLDCPSSAAHSLSQFSFLSVSCFIGKENKNKNKTKPKQDKTGKKKRPKDKRKERSLFKEGEDEGRDEEGHHLPNAVT